MYNMSMKNLNNLSMLAAIAMMSNNSTYGAPGRTEPLFDPSLEPVIVVEPKELIPNGCFQYYFNEAGEFMKMNHKEDFSTVKFRKDEVVFKCVCSKDSIAIKKFQNRNK